MNKSFGIILVVALAIWSIVFAILNVTDKASSKGAEYYSYATFGVAPLVAALALWLLH